MQGLSSGGASPVPSNWLSLPVVQSASEQIPPCSREVREQIYSAISGNPQRLEIRLLEIEETNDDHGLMSCLLRPFLLHRAPDFHALSYCWNDGAVVGPRKTILVNGFEFLVQPSLWDALQMLRRHGYTTVWADAICLDQEDEAEKAQQVPQMRLIYQRAVEVVIWLGNESNGSTEFLEVLEDIAQSDGVQVIRKYRESELPIHGDETRDIFSAGIRVELAKAYLLQRMIQQLDILGDKISDYELVYMFLQACEDLVDQFTAFFQRPYWRRTWIVQEVASAKKLRILCGDKQVYWEDLASMLILHDGVLDWDDEENVAVQNLFMIEKLRYKINNQIPIGFLTALQRSYGCEASDVRDKFYALLGLCWNPENLLPYVSYAEDNTLNRIMFDLMRRWTDSGSLDVICLQPHIEDNNYSLPGWLPKWLLIGRSSMNDRIVDHIENRRPIALLSAHGHSWMATNRSRGIPQFYDNDRIMLVEGTIIDVIDGLSAACDHCPADSTRQECWQSTSYLPSVENLRKTISRIRYDLYWTLNMYKDRNDNVMADQTLALDCLFSDSTKRFWRDQGFDYHIDWLEKVKDFKIFGRQFHQWLLNRPLYRNHAKIGIQNALLKNDNDKVDPLTHERIVIRAFGHVFEDLRRLMTTRNGRVGWAHPNARPGDAIVLLKGCNLPVILAKSAIAFHGRQTYAVVGDAYVHGIMRGELWEAASKQLTGILLS